MNLSPLPIQKFFANNGRPLVGGKLFTYEAGTTTKIATYTDSSGGTPNTNPIILDFRGECEVWLDPNLTYKFVLSPPSDTDPPTAPFWTVDDITVSVAFDYTAVDIGSVNNISLEIPRISSPAAFTRILFKASNTNTGPTTLQINGGTAAPLCWQNIGAFSGGEIQQNGYYQAIFDGANWQLQGPNLQPTQMRTAVETSASVVPVNFCEFPGAILRYKTNTTPADTDMSDAFQNAIASASPGQPSVTFGNFAAIGKPILIPAGSQQGLSIRGNGRVASIINPLASDIKQAPVNKNALIVNQSDNGSLFLSQVRCFDASAYTGKFLYAVDGGGDDGSCQALFSAVVDNCWFSFSSNNTGIFQGGFSNLSVTKSVFEATKDACFILEGAGNGDLMFLGNVMNFCYDSFIRQVDDGQIINLLLIEGLHVYQHLRGRVIDLTEAYQANINDVQLELSADHVGDVGLIRLQDCEDIRVTNCTMAAQLGTPRGAVGIDILGDVSATFIGLKITADVGLRTQGNGTLDLTFIDCDFLGCGIGWQHLSGNAGGQIRFIGCRISNADTYCMITSAGTPTFSVYFDDCEILNAGLDGVATNRNVNIATTGTLRFFNTKVGQDNAGAAAAYFFRTDGTGTAKVAYCPIIGTPPTGLVDPASTQAIQFIWEPTANLSGSKSFQLAVGTNTITVNDAEIQTASLVVLTPTNAAASVVQGSAQNLVLAAIVNRTSFTFNTGNGTNAAANANFRYRIIP
jgi:hypothetical protein